MALPPPASEAWVLMIQMLRYHAALTRRAMPLVHYSEQRIGELYAAPRPTVHPLKGKPRVRSTSRT